MEFLFMGIDISKDTLDYALVSNKKVLDFGQVENSPKGITELLSVFKKQSLPVWVCAEHTGHYGNLLVAILESNKVRYSMINSLEIVRSSGLSRGKSDKIDAQRIALYGETFSHKLKPSTSGSEEMKLLGTLSSTRDRYVKIRTQLKNALRALVIAGKTLPLEEEIERTKQNILHLDRSILQVENKIKALIKSKKEVENNYKKITSVPGIGLISAIKIITYTKNFKEFDDPRKFCCYCGLAPFEYTSGTSVKGKTKTSKYRNKDLKSVLFNAAASAILNDPQLRAYYKRKVGEGKHKLSVLNAVACKIVARVFAVQKRNEAYVKLSM